jgi:hypothetical protein
MKKERRLKVHRTYCFIYCKGQSKLAQTWTEYSGRRDTGRRVRESEEMLERDIGITLSDP